MSFPFASGLEGVDALTIEKIVLIEPASPGFHVFSRYKLPRLGLPLLGAQLRQELGITPRIYFEEVAKIDWSEVEKADLVGISTITTTAPAAYAILKRVKRIRDIPVVMGGPHVSFLPEEALDMGADFVVRREGEETFVELLRYLSGGEGDLSEIAGLSYKTEDGYRHNAERPLIRDLTRLPWPDVSLIEGLDKSKIIPVLTSRGCPFGCNFCSVTSMFGRKYRFREIGDVLNELQVLFARRPKSIFFFYDDNFTASPAHTKELLRGMKERGITPRWTAQARVDVVKDAELMRLMADTGCIFLYLGLESINPATLKAYNKSQTVEDIVEAVRGIHEYGIKVHGMFVLGSDEDDRATIRDTVHFAKKTGIDTVQFLVLTPMPGTEVYEEMCRDDRIFVHDWSKFSGHHVVYYPKKMSPYQLQKEASLRAMLKFYSLWQSWKLGIRFRWKDMARGLYAHRVVVRWKSRNRDYLSDLKRRYKEDLADLRRRYREEVAKRKGKPIKG
jgi:radical SAM superfamily enzyme YgiQ (UPF0313 family)